MGFFDGGALKHALEEIHSTVLKHVMAVMELRYI
jgi:hypothetical protein